MYVHSCTHMHARDEKPWEFDVSPQEDRVVFMGNGQGDQDLFVLNLKNWKVTRLTNTPDYESAPAFSPNGKSVVYAAGDGDRADHIFVRSLDGKSVHQLTNVDYNDHSLTFSPDGKTVVFARDSEYISGGQMRWGTWQGSQLYTVATDGSQLRQLTRGSFKEIVFAFSKDATSFTLPNNIGKVSDNTSAEKKPVKSLTSNGGTAPAFLPDGKHILFFSFVEDSCCILYDALFLMDSSGRGAHPIAQKIKATNPMFSANRKHVYFILYPQYSLWRMDVDGRDRIKIADSTLFKKPLGWKAKNRPRL